MPITKGFKGRQPGADVARDRLPPGQYVTQDFPVLTAGPTQRTAVENWSLSLQRNGEPIARWSWAEFVALERVMCASIRCLIAIAIRALPSQLGLVLSVHRVLDAKRSGRKSHAPAEIAGKVTAICKS
jgi:hypothetical protein